MAGPVCEINTMPGFTARSSFARAWEASGVPLPRLLSWLIDLALVRPAPRGAGATDAEVVWFDRGRRALIRAGDESLERRRPVFTLVTPDGAAPVRLSPLGAHQVANALAAAATAWALGVGVDRIAAALSDTGPRSTSRMAVRTRDTDGVTVDDDAYNAFPESMAAALHATAALAADGSRRAVAVLGEMVA